MNWKNIKIYGRLTIASTAIIFLTIMIGVIAITNLGLINNKTKQQAENYVPFVNATYNIDKTLHELINNLTGFNSEGDEYYKEKIGGHH